MACWHKNVQIALKFCLINILDSGFHQYKFKVQASASKWRLVRYLNFFFVNSKPFFSWFTKVRHLPQEWGKWYSTLGQVEILVSFFVFATVATIGDIAGFPDQFFRIFEEIYD